MPQESGAPRPSPRLEARIEFKEGDRVSAVAALTAHHLATNHPCGGSNNSGNCEDEDCDFAVEDGVVIAGGIGAVKS